ncbi:MAG: L,D-transpeptidase family protein [Austwickia sp.]|nr:L,D-transpeptidase family protein [Actinomycetota bacterium]MCB1252994.1 L,D-transpeptidase family protein [Austwickia sp.]
MGLLTLLVTPAAGCADAPGSGGAGGSEATTSAPPARVEISVTDGATDVAADSVITVRVAGGRLDTVSIASADGKRTVAGAVGPDQVWSSTGRLVPTTTYRVTATTRSDGGAQTTNTATFTTRAPGKTVGYTVTPDGWTVGAGMPIQVNFDAPIPKDARAGIEKQLTVASAPAQPGGWGWTSDVTLMYRPQNYWAAGTTIDVSAPLAGTKVGPNAYLMEDNGAKLTIGVQRILRVDLAKHTMTDTENGKLVRSFLISGGRPGERFETRGGTKVVTDKFDKIVMDSSTFGINKGDPDYYKTPVNYAMRLTDSGEFLHSAPWSVGQQGYANVSHGCINMAPGDALWLFNRIQSGDVVETTGSNYPLPPGEAGIPVWLYTWPQWQAMSAVPPPATPTTSPPSAAATAKATSSVS